MKRLRYFAIPVLMLCCGAGVGQSLGPRVPTPISLVQIIANPDRFDRKDISTVGFIEFQDTQGILYLNQVDQDARLLPNALSVDFGSHVNADDRRLLNLKYVYVMGKFDAQDRGPRSEQSGSIHGWSIIGWSNHAHQIP
jgi:hypothetical protein